MPPGTRNTPLTGFLFGFKISEGPLDLDYNGGTAFFRSVGGIKSDNDVVDYYEGGVTGWTRKVIGVRKWPNLVLKQGFTVRIGTCKAQKPQAVIQFQAMLI